MTKLNTVEFCYESGRDYNISRETYIIDYIARFLTVVNSSFNFVIYCLVGSQFRSELENLFRRNLPWQVHYLSQQGQ